MPKRQSGTPILGPKEIAELIGTTPEYVNQLVVRSRKYRARATEGGAIPSSAFPAEDYIVSERPLWLRATVVTWAKANGWLDADGKPIPRK